METVHNAEDTEALRTALENLVSDEANVTTEPKQAISIVPAVQVQESVSQSDQREAFYKNMRKEHAEPLQQTANRIRERLRASIIETGKDLLIIKTKMNGFFVQWLKIEFDMAERTAWNYISAAEAFGDTPEIVDALPPVTIYKLSAKATPQTLRDAVKKEVKSGTALNKKEVECRISEAKELELNEKKAQREQQEAESKAAADVKKWEVTEKKLIKQGATAVDIEEERKFFKQRREDNEAKRKENDKLKAEKKQADEQRLKEEKEDRSRKAAQFIRENLGDKFAELLTMFDEGVDNSEFVRELVEE